MRKIGWALLCCGLVGWCMPLHAQQADSVILSINTVTAKRLAEDFSIATQDDEVVFSYAMFVLNQHNEVVSWGHEIWGEQQFVRVQNSFDEGFLTIRKPLPDNARVVVTLGLLEMDTEASVKKIKEYIYRSLEANTQTLPDSLAANNSAETIRKMLRPDFSFLHKDNEVLGIVTMLYAHEDLQMLKKKRRKQTQEATIKDIHLFDQYHYVINFTLTPKED